MVALSIHSFFEGLALGLCTTFASTFSIFIAILIHKGIAGMSMGISLLKANDLKWMQCMCFIFAISSPIGIVLGMMIKGCSDIIQIIFTSIAAGSFVYIGCSEVVVQEFSKEGDKKKKVFVYLLGATIILLVGFCQ
jgi:solute carrier family 39 (zinc transporter), member 1/2/3